MIDPKCADLVSHIYEASTDACNFVEGTSKSDFIADKRSQQAVIFSLLIIGEAATKLMEQHPEFVEDNSQIPWRSMRGMRNRIAHGYFKINLNIVWDTVQNALPELRHKIVQLK